MPHLPKSLSGSHKPTSHDQVEKQAREEACKKKSETASQKERAARTLREQEQERIRQAQEEREETENEEWDMVNAQGLKAQEARKVKAVRRDKALPSAPWDEGLREKYGIFYD